MSDLRVSELVRGKVGVALVIAALGVVALVGLIARELFTARATPKHLAAPAPASLEEAPSAAAPPASPARPAHVTAAIARAASPRPGSAASPAPDSKSAPDAPPGAQTLASLIENPRAFAPSNVVQNARNHSETYSYEHLAPFVGADITRDKKDPFAWQINAAFGPGMDGLAPRGGLREAFVQKDEQGNPFATWFAIESGPLAPAYAVKRGDVTRVVSRPYLEANRGEFPPSVTAVLDR